MLVFMGIASIYTIMNTIIDLKLVREKFPSFLKDKHRTLTSQSIAIPRKTHISGHFRLNARKMIDLEVYNFLTI